jgi:hypothetical protein
LAVGDMVGFERIDDGTGIVKVKALFKLRSAFHIYQEKALGNMPVSK